MIINLESPGEEACSHLLSCWIQETMQSKDPNEKRKIRRLWGNEKWESIMRKIKVEGSTWYVWWMDGVRAFMARRSRS
jgi:hypothetical protein